MRHSPRYTLAILILVAITTVCRSAEQAFTITNLEDGETLRYPVALLSGKAPGEGAVYVRNVNNSRPDGSNSVPIVAGKFVILVELVQGANTLRLTSPLAVRTMTLNYQPMTTRHRVNVVYVTAEDGDTTYQTQFENDPQNYAAKLGTAAKLMQTVTAECMNRAGHGRRTFQLELDQDGKVKVHTFKYPAAVDTLYQQDGGQLWRMIGRQLGRTFNRRFDKCIAVMAFTRRDPETGKLHAHTALGGGHLGLFGSGSMCSWPDSIRDVHRVFTDPTPIDGKKIHDDSVGRSTVWGLASTTIGAMLHELAHTFGLPHVKDRRGVMSRGFDYLNRTVTILEPPRRGKTQPRRFGPDEIMKWTKDSAAKLASSSWFDPGEAGASKVKRKF